ncbi:MAG: 4-(cytidine 5'-diphospho)-2-C-methyl-D-erythritol kinase [Verrucomicrobiales bacterium]|jgi:4-diphosphocytidyl-2-C-methyl-D-erythritol kinase|nr:4-(cytidine 5'-diphospho)-2-C-methyl-D-erythritol kinase [Verrucomicrobiales bacterium]
MTVRCPAKINLYLRIVGQRPDGFHNLETLMCPVAVYDEMTLAPAADGEVSLRLTGGDISAGEDNLVMRAARLVQRLGGTRRGVSITLQKNIPVGGGLAGGSSNAAHTLMALNEFWDCALTARQLDEAAATLGSDVNFFLCRKPAVCTGRGELVRPVTLTGKWHGLLLNPGFGVPTPWAFKTYAAHPARGTEGALTLACRAADGGVSEFKLRNDLEPAVFGKYLWIAAAKAWLLAQPGVLDSLMSGSGATVFALTATPAEAGRVARSAREYFGPEAWIKPVELLV